MPQETLNLPLRVLVTGAAGGIGAALVRRLVRVGVHVLATDLAAAPRDTEANRSLARALLPAFGPDTAVVLLGSVAAPRASPKTPFYAASKAALRNVGASLAVALQVHGVRVNVVAPGLIDAALAAGLNRELARERGVPVAQIEAERMQAIPAGRAGSVDEVVSACLFLLSARAAYCTGMTLHPTGGAMAGVN